MLVFRQIHHWLLDTYQDCGYQFYFITREESAGALIHDACTYMWRDVGNMRQGITIGYEDQKVSCALWYVNEAGELAPIREIYLADPSLFDFISKLISLQEPNLQGYCYIYRPEASEGEESSARDRTTGAAQNRRRSCGD